MKNTTAYIRAASGMSADSQLAAILSYCDAIDLPRPEIREEQSQADL